MSGNPLTCCVMACVCGNETHTTVRAMYFFLFTKIVVLSGHMTDDVIAMKVLKMDLAWQYLLTSNFLFLYI